MTLPSEPLERPVQVLTSVEELLAGATAREPISDGVGKSGATLERVIINGEPYIVKHVSLAQDWTMRAVGELVSANVKLCRLGVFEHLPRCINQPIVAMAVTRTGSGTATRAAITETALLMRDVSQWLVPVSDAEISADANLRFLDHMAALHARFWAGGHEIEVVPLMHRYLELSPWMAAAEADIDSPHLVPQLVGKGWSSFAAVAPRAASVVTPLAWDPGPLVAALEKTPQTFVHGNWKLDNLGIDGQGRTVLLDWELPGRAPACSDLAWYLAINCRRLPISKEATISDYREALERHGVDTEPWWDGQLSLSLLGALVQFGWEKALGGYDDELAWWEEKAVQGSQLLG